MTSSQSTHLFSTSSLFPGGYPSVPVEGMDKLTLLALRDKSLVHDENSKVKVGPWSDVKVFSQYAKDGMFVFEPFVCLLFF